MKPAIGQRNLINLQSLHPSPLPNIHLVTRRLLHHRQRRIHFPNIHLYLHILTPIIISDFRSQSSHIAPILARSTALTPHRRRIRSWRQQRFAREKLLQPAVFLLMMLVNRCGGDWESGHAVVALHLAHTAHFGRRRLVGGFDLVSGLISVVEIYVFQ